jgi:uncharacterized protein
MRIGLLSDTHGYLEPRIADHFENCDEIWHAGDIGDLAVIHALEAIRPVRAVFGNIDGLEIQTAFPEDLHFECDGVKIWITHIAGSPPRYNPRIRKELNKEIPDVLICGHSHILKVGRDPAYGNMLFINPGAAGNHGFHAVKTLIRFSIVKGTVKDMEVVELGKRGAINQKL